MKLKSLIRLLLAALLIGLVIWFSEPRSLTRITEINLLPTILVLGMTILLTIISVLRWNLILTWLEPGLSLPRLGLFRVVTIGLSLGLVVNQDIASVGTRITYLNRGQNMSVEQASFSVFLDRWFDVLVLLLLAPVSCLFLSGLIPATPALALMLVLLAVFLGAGLVRPQMLTHLFAIGFQLAVSLIRRVLGRKGTRLPLTLPVQNLARGQLLTILVLSVMRILIVAVRTWLVVLAVDIDLSVLETFLLIPITQLTALIPLAPAGLGLFEAGWYGALRVMGIPGSDSLVFITMLRILTTFGLLAMLGLTEIAWQTSRRLRRPVTQL